MGGKVATQGMHPAHPIAHPPPEDTSPKQEDASQTGCRRLLAPAAPHVPKPCPAGQRRSRRRAARAGGGRQGCRAGAAAPPRLCGPLLPSSGQSQRGGPAVPPAASSSSSASSSFPWAGLPVGHRSVGPTSALPSPPPRTRGQAVVSPPQHPVCGLLGSTGTGTKCYGPREQMNESVAISGHVSG